MDLAVVAYHSGDEYEHTASLSRISYYGITGFPTVKFDGIVTQVGGGTGLYAQYLAKYNSRIAIPSSYTIELEGSNSGQVDYQFEITVEKVDDGVDNPVMHVALTESHIPDYWGGLSEVNYCTRLMAPNQNGTTLDFSSNTTNEITINLTIEQEWVNENCELVVFLQNNANKEILQGAKYDISDFGTTNMNDASILGATLPYTICNESVKPKVLIANYGLDDLTSLDLSLDVNGTTVSSLEWSGNLAYLESELVEFPEVEVVIEPSNAFDVIAENPNGLPDEVPFNNIYAKNINEASNIVGPVTLVMLLGDNPEEISWEVKDSQGGILYEGGNYTGSPPTVIQEFDLVDPNCYSFTIYDEAGDGLTGGGSYKLYDGNSDLFRQASDYGMEDQVQFGIGLTGEPEFAAGSAIEIYPNPTNQNANISFELMETQTVALTVFNSTGAVVHSKAIKEYSVGKHAIEFNGEGIPAGIYYVNLMIGDIVEVQKLIIK